MRRGPVMTPPHWASPHTPRWGLAEFARQSSRLLKSSPCPPPAKHREPADGFSWPLYPPTMPCTEHGGPDFGTSFAPLSILGAEFSYGFLHLRTFSRSKLFFRIPLHFPRVLVPYSAFNLILPLWYPGTTSNPNFGNAYSQKYGVSSSISLKDPRRVT
ncbi:hypothetical protein BCR34DRAFT_82331 [Clohesyomyces aquaticus]|uniref:Uncharacterized protein n=1 Tax=Clohesyomyces aquaticus TaxID=1231657 RepID=A0A1Y1YY41_9PLEO|nr:hypothetical protein BCR34DRAFT_82331 [Clohesyomyces aquaticus]